jgi:hypothetical protein
MVITSFFHPLNEFPLWVLLLAVQPIYDVVVLVFAVVVSGSLLEHKCAPSYAVPGKHNAEWTDVLPPWLGV